MRYSYFRDVNAECETCGKKWMHPGAQGTAAKHSLAQGHVVSVDVQLHVTYYGIEEQQEAAMVKRKGKL